MGPDASPAGNGPCQSPPSLREALGRPAFRLAVKEQGDTLLLRLTGEFEWACVGRVEAALERASRALTKRVVFDLQGLTFLDSGGLRTILRTQERARYESFEVVVVRPLGLANRVFTLTRAGAQLTMVDRPPSLNGARAPRSRHDATIRGMKAKR